jgi:anti-sigma regulatory factor (Ser/Thr protein kinase)
MTSRRASDDTLDSAVSRVSAADGEPISPSLRAALDRLAATSGPAESYTVEPDPESVTAARHFATGTLEARGMAGLCDDVGLVVSELVTNALRHSLPGHGLPGCAEAARSAIRLRLLLEPPYVLCGVIDQGAALPLRREPDYIAETGRGLHLVDSFSTRWGWTRLPPVGKIVWAIFQVPQ